MTLRSGSYQSKIKSCCSHLCSLVVPPDGLVSARFSMICTLIPPNIDFLCPDGHSLVLLCRKPSINSHSFDLLLSHANISHTIPHFFPTPLSSLQPWLLSAPMAKCTYGSPSYTNSSPSCPYIPPPSVYLAASMFLCFQTYWFAGPAPKPEACLNWMSEAEAGLGRSHGLAGLMAQASILACSSHRPSLWL